MPALYLGAEKLPSAPVKLARKVAADRERNTGTRAIARVTLFVREARSRDALNLVSALLFPMYRHAAAIWKSVI